MRNRTRERKSNNRVNRKLGNLLKCVCLSKQSHSTNEMIPSSESLATKDYSESAYSSQVVGEDDKKLDTGSIEEAELSLRDTGSLSYEV